MGILYTVSQWLYNLFKLCTGRKVEKSFHTLKIRLKWNTATFQAKILLDSTILRFGQVNEEHKPHAAFLKNVYQQSSWQLRNNTAVKNMLHDWRFIEFSYITESRIVNRRCVLTFINEVDEFCMLGADNFLLGSQATWFLTIYTMKYWLWHTIMKISPDKCVYYFYFFLIAWLRNFAAWPRFYDQFHNPYIRVTTHTHCYVNSC